MGIYYSNPNSRQLQRRKSRCRFVTKQRHFASKSAQLPCRFPFINRKLSSEMAAIFGGIFPGGYPFILFHFIKIVKCEWKIVAQSPHRASTTQHIAVITFAISPSRNFRMKFPFNGFDSLFEVFHVGSSFAPKSNAITQWTWTRFIISRFVSNVFTRTSGLNSM